MQSRASRDNLSRYVWTAQSGDVILHGYIKLNPKVAWLRKENTKDTRSEVGSVMLETWGQNQSVGMWSYLPELNRFTSFLHKARYCDLICNRHKATA
jgi:hypothetical protein